MTVASAGAKEAQERAAAGDPAWPVKTIAFAHGASRPRNLPCWQWPEIALAGRSNVGKSSLLNRLVRRSGMARVSKTPGRTQQINFFLINGTWCLVDLPGYGFARVPLQVRESWRHLVEAYLKRRTVRGVIVIVDLRRGLQPDDVQLLDFLDRAGVPTCVAATKADKVPRGQRRPLIDALSEQHPGGAVVCSAASGEGVADLVRRMREWLEGGA